MPDTADLAQLYRDATTIPPPTTRTNGHVPIDPNTLFPTGREFFTDVPTAIDWILQPIFAPESLILLAASPKAGKTELLMGAISAMVHGNQFCGHRPQKRGQVLYLCEQDPKSLAPYAERRMLHQSDQWRILSYAAMRQHGLTWAQAVEAAIEQALTIGAQVVIVDTFGRMAGLRGDDENSSGKIMEVMDVLLHARSRGLCVVASHHLSRNDAVRGSTAIEGEPDHIIEMRRPEGGFSDPRVRILEFKGRLGVNETRSIRLEDDWSWSDLGLGAKRKIDEIEQSIIDVLSIYESSAMTRDEIMAETGHPQTSVHRALKMLLEDETISQRGKGNKAEAYRYWKAQNQAQNDSFHTPYYRGSSLESTTKGVDDFQTTSPQSEPMESILPDACSAPDLCARMGPCTHAPHCPDIKSR